RHGPLRRVPQPARRGLGGPGVERARGGASGERAGRADRGRRVPCRAGRRGGGRGPGGAGVVGRRGPGPSPGGRPPALRVDPAGVRRARDALGPVTSPAPEPDAAAPPPHRPGRSGWKPLRRASAGVLASTAIVIRAEEVSPVHAVSVPGAPSLPTIA